VSYGHDIETVWLLVDAARALGWPADIVSTAALRMGTLAIREGFDVERGGLFDEGVPGGEVTKPIKVWWAQFEALAGLWWLYRLTGDEVYLDRLASTLDWIEGPARDAEHGGWYFNVALDGRPDGRGDHKGEVWKTTYHGMRAVLFVDDWMRAAHPED
jgi:mannobiose 2-epimerase